MINLLKRFQEEWHDAVALWWILQITTAQALYCYEFGSFASSLGELANENLIPARLVAGNSYGFRFDLVPTDSGYDDPGTSNDFTNGLQLWTEPSQIYDSITPTTSPLKPFGITAVPLVAGLFLNYLDRNWTKGRPSWF